MLERTVILVTGLIQPVVRVWGVLFDVVTLASGFPILTSVITFLVPELTRMLLIITGRGKMIVPCKLPMAI